MDVAAEAGPSFSYGSAKVTCRPENVISRMGYLFILFSWISFLVDWNDSSGLVIDGCFVTATRVVSLISRRDAVWFVFRTLVDEVQEDRTLAVASWGVNSTARNSQVAVSITRWIFR